MTERLYYKDSGLLSFSSRIIEAGRYGDNLFFTALEETAFYPTSGGQSHDTGKLGDVVVKEVIENDSGDIWHISDSPIGAEGDTVAGEVDKSRRTRNRQLHTAQHILSHVFFKLFGYVTKSVHLGDEYGAVELDAERIDDEKLQQAEELSNAIIKEAVPVQILFASSDELADHNLRKPTVREGTIRIVKIGGHEASACGGTHCDNTSHVAQIVIIGSETMRKRALVKFLAGQQLFDDYRVRLSVTADLSHRLTCHVRDLPERFDRLTDENKGLRKKIGELQRQLLPTQVEELASRSERVGQYGFLLDSQNGLEPQLTTQLAGLVADRIAGVAVLMVDGRLTLAVSTESGLHAGNLVKELVARTDLKGGGNPKIAQAGGATKECIDDYHSILGELLKNG